MQMKKSEPMVGRLRDDKGMSQLAEVQRKYGADPVFREVADLLYGGGSDLIYKMDPDQSSLHVNGSVKRDRKRRMTTAGLSAVGATAGTAGLGYAGYKVGGEIKRARKAGATGRQAFKAGIKGEKFGAALFPLEVAGLGGEVMATHILHGDTKKKLVRKDFNPKQRLQRKAMSGVEVAATQGIRLNKVKMKAAYDAAVKNGTAKEGFYTSRGKLVPNPKKVSKSYDVKWEGEFSKVNADKQQVFGWASIVEINGQPIVDLQGDYISIDEVEKAGYEYVVKSRRGGDMHLRDGDAPVKASDMIESFIVTPEKKQAMKLPESTPTGWWVGYQVNDPDVWAKVKSGQRTGFSIHGRGVRSEM